MIEDKRSRKTTPSWLQDASMHRVSGVHSLEDTSERVSDTVFVVLIVFMFQENKSFGASTICIHPLM